MNENRKTQPASLDPTIAAQAAVTNTGAQLYFKCRLKKPSAASMA